VTAPSAAPLPRSSLARDFYEFILRGNVVDLAVAVIVGAAFSGVVSSFADDIVMPPIGLLLGGTDFSNLFVLLRPGPKGPPPYASLADAKAAGAVTLNYGAFLTKVVTFLIIAAVVFMIIRTLARFKREKPAPPPPAMRDCPYCLTPIPLKATKCAHCTSSLAAAAP
jgi:large conductance mechanosensitive channel